MLSITKIFHFESSHKLPNHLGKCKNLHGHSYKLEVTVSLKPDSFRPKRPEEDGMILDFSILKQVVNDCIIKPYDHKYLNDFFENPTAEVLVSNFVEILNRNLSSYAVEVVKLKLWETHSSYASYRKES